MSLSTRELIERELLDAPEPLQQEVYDFVRFLKSRSPEESFNGLLLSERALAKDWATLIFAGHNLNSIRSASASAINPDSDNFAFRENFTAAPCSAGSMLTIYRPALSPGALGGRPRRTRVARSCSLRSFAVRARPSSRVRPRAQVSSDAKSCSSIFFTALRLIGIKCSVSFNDTACGIGVSYHRLTPSRG